MKHVPFGIRDFLPNEVHERYALVRRMENYLEEFEYKRIITPSIERYDNISHALGNALKDHCIMFFDSSGSRLVLRPDHTAAIARIVSSRLSDQLPIKLYYYDPVFRKDPLLGETEIFQFGLEHIGNLSVTDEVLIIKHAIDMCKNAGLNDVQIHIAHPDLFKELTQKECEDLESGCFSNFSKLPVKSTLEMVTDTKYFKDLNRNLTKHNVNNHTFVNKSLYKDMSYYNGLYFDIVSPKYGKVIGSGGRYDTVLNAFNQPLNAFGFGINMHYLEKAISS